MGGMIESVMVARVEKGIIVESFVFAGTDREDQNRLAEEQFKDLCQTHISNWDEYTAEDVDACIEDGTAEYAGGKNSIQLHHADNTLILPSGGIPNDEPENPKRKPRKTARNNLNHVRSGEIFIIQPSGAESQDKLHQVCQATKAGDIYDIHGADQYEELGSRASMKFARKLAAKLGSKNPMVI